MSENKPKTNLGSNELITPEQVADVLGVSVGTLSVWRSTGRYNIPFVKTGRSVKYKAADIQAFIDKGTVTSTASKSSWNTDTTSLYLTISKDKAITVLECHSDSEAQNIALRLAFESPITINLSHTRVCDGARLSVLLKEAVYALREKDKTGIKAREFIDQLILLASQKRA